MLYGSQAAFWARTVVRNVEALLRVAASVRGSTVVAPHTQTSASSSIRRKISTPCGRLYTDNLPCGGIGARDEEGQTRFLQKPLTHTIHEARRIAEIARETDVATQMLSRTRHPKTPVCCASGFGLAQSGRCRSRRLVGAVLSGRRNRATQSDAEPIPAGLDWNLWLGLCARTSLHRAYVPFVLARLGRLRLWRSLVTWVPTASTQFFRVLKLEKRPRVWRQVQPIANDETYPLASVIQLYLPARGDILQ